MRRFQIVLVTMILSWTLFARTAVAGTDNATLEYSSRSLALNLYYNGALFNHTEALDLRKGANDIVFKGICPELLPGSIYVSCANSRIASYSFQLPPMSISALLEAYKGKTVYLKDGDKCCAQKTMSEATLVSFKNEKAIVKTRAGLFETEASKIVFPFLSAGLSNGPVVRIRVWSPTAGQAVSLGLFYLSRRLGWSAEYTGMLDRDEEKINVEAFAFLKNRSSMDIKNAHMKLVAGDVNFRYRSNFPVIRAFEAKAMAAAPPEPAREKVFEYHVYRIQQVVTLTPKQSKYIMLFQAGNLQCKKKLVLSSGNYYYYRHADRSMKNLHPEIFLEVDTGSGKDAQPFPAGLFRVYKRDKEGSAVFIGEQKIASTAAGEKIVLNLGRAFDVTARKRQISFNRVRTGDKYKYRYESSYEIEVHNSKDKPATVIIKEGIPGDWTITGENLKHFKEEAHLVSWTMNIPGRATSILRYSVRIWD